jgi:hypothetical protein
MPGQRNIILAFLTVLFVCCTLVFVLRSLNGSRSKTEVQKPKQDVQAPLVSAQTAPPIQIYRGRLGDQHIQMELTRNGDVTIGRYFYDQFQKDLRLEGRPNKDRRLELRETDETGRHTGTFVCKRADERGPIDMDLECDWSKPDGSGELNAWLTEQAIDLPKGLAIKPKQVYQRGRIVNLSYPELISSSRQSRIFNARVPRLARGSLSDFVPETGNENVSLNVNYNVLLATDEIISIELSEDFYAGGAHPSEDWRIFNYDVRNDREFRITDLVKDERPFKAAIWKYAATAINKLAVQLEQNEAREENRQPEKRDDVVSDDEPAEILAWGFTPKGVVVYFDFAHVMWVFSKVVVPYSEVKDHLKPDSPISKFGH